MQPAVARPRVERDILEAVALDHVDNDIRLPSPIGFFDGLYFSGGLCHVTFLLWLIQCISCITRATKSGRVLNPPLLFGVLCRDITSFFVLCVVSLCVRPLS